MNDLLSRFINRFRLLLPSNPEKTFTKIYQHNDWGSNESVSGPGSTLSATEALRSKLPLILKKLEIKSMLDAPCGDCNWISKVDLSGVDYTGADIVQKLIDENRQKYPEKKFIQLDIIHENLPAADLILCRDCFIHLRTKEIENVLNNFRKTRAKYLLASTYPVQLNKQILTGHYRPVNLMRPPFNLPEPLDLIPDNAADGTERYLGLWKLF